MGPTETMVALLFTGASMVAFSGLPVTRRSASMVAGLGLWAVGAIAWGPPRMIAAARPAERPDTDAAWADDRRRLPAWVGPVGRGLLIGIPLAVIFAVLFASADPIFRRGLDEVFGLQIDLYTLDRGESENGTNDSIDDPSVMRESTDVHQGRKDV